MATCASSQLAPLTPSPSDGREGASRRGAVLGHECVIFSVAQFDEQEQTSGRELALRLAQLKGLGCGHAEWGIIAPLLRRRRYTALRTCRIPGRWKCLPAYFLPDSEATSLANSLANSLDNSPGRLGRR